MTKNIYLKTLKSALGHSISHYLILISYVCRSYKGKTRFSKANNKYMKSYDFNQPNKLLSI